MKVIREIVYYTIEEGEDRDYLYEDFNPKYKSPSNIELAVMQQDEDKKSRRRANEYLRLKKLLNEIFEIA